MQIHLSADLEECARAVRTPMTVDEFLARFPEVPPDLRDEPVLGEYVHAFGLLLRVAQKPSRIRGPKAVKYIWSERVPVGTHLTSNMGLTQVRVLRSGAPDDRKWVEERVNVREDFKKYFSESETPKPAGIAVLTDSDDTNSSAQGDYRAFRACRG